MVYVNPILLFYNQQPANTAVWRYSYTAINWSIVAEEDFWLITAPFGLSISLFISSGRDCGRPGSFWVVVFSYNWFHCPLNAAAANVGNVDVMISLRGPEQLIR